MSRGHAPRLIVSQCVSLSDVVHLVQMDDAPCALSTETTMSRALEATSSEAADRYAVVSKLIRGS